MLGSIGVLGSPAEQEAWAKNLDELRAQKGRQVMRDFLKIRGDKKGRSKNGLLACKLLGHYAKLVLVSTAATHAVGDRIAGAWDLPCTNSASLIELCSFLTGGTVEERASTGKTLAGRAKAMGQGWLRRARRALNALSDAGHTRGTVLCLRGEEIEVDGERLEFPFALPDQPGTAAADTMPLCFPLLDDLRSAVTPAAEPAVPDSAATTS
ncbi:unnamed protein product, partial [Ectocarpus sp. 13 AM-2016]